MPLDEYGDHDEREADAGSVKVFDEFDCPVCNANNPYGDGFKPREEIRCFYCGTSFVAKVDDSGKLKLKEL
jgi:hypothetical protein